MEFQFRDSLIRSQKGQGIIEYILVLVVTIAVILGAVYQFNMAFRNWAQSYFGDYLSCLLETGELPTIGGNPGDTGTCNQFFKDFNIQDGRPLLAQGPPQTPSQARSIGGTRENTRGGGRGGGGGGGGGGRFTVGGQSARANGPQGAHGGAGNSNTGNTGISSKGGGYSASGRNVNPQEKDKLDNGFAFENESNKQQRRPATQTKSGDGFSSKGIPLPPKPPPKPKGSSDDSGMTFADFLRFLIIAAIIIALLFFLGGQMLQIGKSME